jgi:5S rRNA maturation endonuclease (ribonuclease M5)
VFVAEGEKDADTLTRLGYVGTTLPNGAGANYNSIHDKYFRDKRVLIIGDNDEPGRAHAGKVAAALAGVAAEVVAVDIRAVDPDVKPKGDISDVCAAHGDDYAREALERETRRRTPRVYSLEDYNTIAPYAEIAAIKDLFRQSVRKNELEEAAKAAGFKGFRKMCADYENSLKGKRSDDAANFAWVKQNSFVTNFDGQPATLNCGGWTADDSGITSGFGMNAETALTHPLLPVERLRDVETGNIKMKIAFSRGRGWILQVADMDILSSDRKIIKLANYDIAVTSVNAKPLVRYISDVSSLNHDAIPERKCVSRLGYIGGFCLNHAKSIGCGFVPYIDGVVFEGGERLAGVFASVANGISHRIIA